MFSYHLSLIVLNVEKHYRFNVRGGELIVMELLRAQHRILLSFLTMRLKLQAEFGKIGKIKADFINPSGLNRFIEVNSFVITTRLN